MGATTPLLTADEAAAVIGVSAETLRRQYRAGKIPAYRVGRALRFDPGELRDAFRSRPVDQPGAAVVAPDFDAPDTA